MFPESLGFQTPSISSDKSGLPNPTQKTDLTWAGMEDYIKNMWSHKVKNLGIYPQKLPPLKKNKAGLIEKLRLPTIVPKTGLMYFLGERGHFRFPWHFYGPWRKECNPTFGFCCQNPIVQNHWPTHMLRVEHGNIYLYPRRWTIIMEVKGRSFSFLNGRFVGYMLIFRGVILLLIKNQAIHLNSVKPRCWGTDPSGRICGSHTIDGDKSASDITKYFFCAVARNRWIDLSTTVIVHNVDSLLLFCMGILIGILVLSMFNT